MEGVLARSARQAECGAPAASLSASCLPVFPQPSLLVGQSPCQPLGPLTISHPIWNLSVILHKLCS